MTIQEFENRYREQARDILNQLQDLMLASSHLEASLAEIGQAIQTLTHDVEQFIAEQRSGAGPED